VPVHNEEADLESSVCRLRRYLDARFPFPTVVTIADNASTDGTWAVAQRLAASRQSVRAVRLSEKGRGRALRAVWSVSDAEVVAYMDVDLSAGPDALLPLVAPLFSGHSDLAIGTRLAPGAVVVRGPRGEVVSRVYNALLHVAFGNRFSDAQCGFKALRGDVARALLPHVADDRWFFDTELLVLAERNGLRVAEVPVDWTDDPDARVNVTRTAIDDLKGIARMRCQLSAGRGRADLPGARRAEPLSPPARFARVGAVSTVSFLALFLLLRRPLGAEAATAASLVTCTAVSTALHWRPGADEGGRVAAICLGACGLAVNLMGTGLALTVAQLLGRTSELDQVVSLLIGLGPAALGRLLVVRALGASLRVPPGAAPHRPEGWEPEGHQHRGAGRMAGADR
jgi:hypothetical protein